MLWTGGWVIHDLIFVPVASVFVLWTWGMSIPVLFMYYVTYYCFQWGCEENWFTPIFRWRPSQLSGNGGLRLSRQKWLLYLDSWRGNWMCFLSSKGLRGGLFLLAVVCSYLFCLFFRKLACVYCIMCVQFFVSFN